MCRVEERIYIGADGHRSKFEEAFPCDKSRGGRLCSKVKRRTTEYYPKKGTMSRDDTPSPINPPTPTGTGTYLTHERRPSGTGVRPSTRDGPKAIKPEIIIEFGSKKGKGTKYAPSVSVSTGAYNRSSLGASSVGSGDIAVESPGSDASHTIRTGFPEAPLPPPSGFSQADGYIATPPPPRAHHRHNSSTSSFTGSSRTPSLYITSDPDYDSPTSHRTARYPPTIVHNPSTSVAPPSPSRRQPVVSTGAYRTTLVTPQDFSHDMRTPDGLYPLDYAEFADRSASSHASSGAPEITRRGKDRDNQRKKKEDDRRRQEELDRQVAEEMAKEENVKQVRFELGRAEARAQDRAERSLAEKEKIRAEDREEARRRNQKEREKQDREDQAAKDREDARRRSQKEREKQEREEQAAKDRKKDKSKPPTNDFTKRPAGARRGSMTQAQIEEQRRLLAAEGLHMQNEKAMAEARDREERLALSRQQQEMPGYWDPRGGDRTLSNTTSAIGRRNSITSRNGVSSTAPPTGLSRSNSNRRPNVIQPNPPPINTQVPQNYTGRPPSARHQSGPPVSFPSNFNQDYNRPPSARRPSYSQENPFAAPPTRGSGSSLDNPFAPAPSVLSPSATVHDPWDARTMQDALPVARPAKDGRYTMQQRGEAVINRSVTHSHAAQQATRAMGRAGVYEDAFETDSEDDDHAPSYPPRSSLSTKTKKKY